MTEAVSPKGATASSLRHRDGVRVSPSRVDLLRGDRSDGSEGFLRPRLSCEGPEHTTKCRGTLSWSGPTGGSFGHARAQRGHATELPEPTIRSWESAAVGHVNCDATPSRSDSSERRRS